LTRAGKGRLGHRVILMLGDRFERAYVSHELEFDGIPLRCGQVVGTVTQSISRRDLNHMVGGVCGSGEQNGRGDGELHCRWSYSVECPAILIDCNDTLGAAATERGSVN
jgi:hypothetical protein